MPGPFSGEDDLIYNITVNGYYADYDFFKSTASAPVAVGVYHSNWTDVGCPGAGATPATTPGTVYDGNSTNNNGGISFPAVSPQNRYMLGFDGMSTQPLELFVYDRLVAVSGITVSSGGSKTVNSTGLPLRAMTSSSAVTGVGVQVWLEVTTATATTALSAVINSYTDQNGVASNVGYPIVAPNVAMKAGDMIGPLPLALGDTGVASVQNIQVLGTAPSAGVVNVVLLKPIYSIPLAAFAWNNRDLVCQIPALPPIPDNACLGIMYLSTNTTATLVWGKIKTAYK